MPSMTCVNDQRELLVGSDSDHCEQEGHSQEHQYPFLHIPIHQGYKITYFPRKTRYLLFSFIIY